VGRGATGAGAWLSLGAAEGEESESVWVRVLSSLLPSSCEVCHARDHPALPPPTLLRGCTGRDKSNKQIPTRENVVCISSSICLSFLFRVCHPYAIDDVLLILMFRLSFNTL
jgi:hypothetical protein